MSEAERQQKTDAIIKLLRRIHALIDEAETPPDSLSDIHAHDERIIINLSPLFGETRQNLRWISADMQKLLKSPWMHGFPNKTAEALFRGEGDESEGIGSGHPEHGRLPAALLELQEREQASETRHPRLALQRPVEPRRHDVEGHVRWTEQNSGFLRTAGRVE